MPQHTVHFHVHPSGDIDYIPGLLHADKRHQVKWTSNASDFFILFNKTPFDAQHTFVGAGGTTGYNTITTDVPDVYHYQFGAFITVKKGKKKVKKLVMTLSCPEIDIP